MRHHTKDKGDQGLGYVIADCLRSGVQVGTLLSEHLPFDIIVIAPDMTLCRLSVKYRAVTNGSIEVSYRSVWSDRHGVHTKPTNKAEFDATAIYCPDTGQVYYVRNDEVGEHGNVALRVVAPQNNQTKGIRAAEKYLGPKRLFQAPLG